MSDTTTRWIDGPTASQEDWDAIEGVLATRGWMSLNRLTSRICVKERAGEIIGFHVLQMVPVAGPLYVQPKYRGTGLAAELADDMLSFLVEIQARGWVVFVESAHAAKLCEERGMTKVEQPVYAMMQPGGVEV